MSPKIRDLGAVTAAQLGPATADAALSEAVDLTGSLAAIRDEQSRLATRRRAALLVANRSGVSFDDLARATGLNRSFLAKEIRAARDEWTGDPTIASGR